MYYFYQDKHKKGPYTLEKLYEFYQQGRIDGLTRILDKDHADRPAELSTLFARMHAMGLDTRQCAMQKAVLESIPDQLGVRQTLQFAWQGYRKKFLRVTAYALLPTLAWLFCQFLTSLMVIGSCEPLVQIYHAGSKLPQANLASIVRYATHNPAVLHLYLLLVITIAAFSIFHLLLLGSLLNIKRLIRAEYAHFALSFTAFKNPIPYLINSLKLLPLYVGMIMLNIPATLLVYRVFPKSGFMPQDWLWPHAPLITCAAIAMLAVLVCAPFMLCYLLVCSATSHPSPLLVWKKARDLSARNYFGWQALLACVLLLNLLGLLLGILAVFLSFSFSLYLLCFYYVYCYRNWLQLQERQQCTPGWQDFHVNKQPCVHAREALHEMPEKPPCGDPS